MSETVEFENEQVRVLRVKHGGSERHPHKQRPDRLIIYINDGHVLRKEGGKQEKVRRKAGEVIWRNQSEHEIENLRSANHAF